MSLFAAIKVLEHPWLPSESPVVTFDPQRKCTWATPEYRASVDCWLLKRFGTVSVAYMFDPRAMGLIGGPVLAINPKHAAVLQVRTSDDSRG